MGFCLSPTRYLLSQQKYGSYVKTTWTNTMYSAFAVTTKKKSFFMLELHSNLHETSIKLLLSFKHVGFVRIGRFTGSSGSALRQALLLNDVRKLSSLDEKDADEFLDHKQLIKRSVLVSQTTLSSDFMLSSCRLRLREEKKPRRGLRARKRSYSDDIKAEPFRYIKRTQKVSSRGRSVKDFEPATGGASPKSAASHAQLGKLANFLSARLTDGLQNLERLQIIVSDKVSLVNRLNQLLLQLRQQLQGGNPSNDRSFLMPLVSARTVDSRRSVRVDMETIVSGTSVPRDGVKVKSIKHDSGPMLGDLELEQQVLLEQFNVIEHVPSSSLFRAEVVVKNLSDIALYDSFVVLTPPKGRKVRARGWQCSGSVAPVVSMGEREARYQLAFQFAPDFSLLRDQKRLEVILWLHWNALPDDHVSNTTPVWHPSESGFAIASVSIDLMGLIGIGGESRNTTRSSWSGRSHVNDVNQLLFISSGSNLAAWFGRPNSEVLLSSIGSVIRPTCALVSLNVKSLDLMQYELGRIIASLPPDVYAMLNPFHHIHLRALQRVLRSMHRQILTICLQASDTADTRDDLEAAGKERILRVEVDSFLQTTKQSTDLKVCIAL